MRAPLGTHFLTPSPEMFDRERVQALFARREDADVRDLLLPSELYHENTKTRRSVLDVLRRRAQDPVAGGTLRRAEARQRRLYDLVQFGAKSYPHVPRITLPAGPGLLGCDALALPFTETPSAVISPP